MIFVVRRLVFVFGNFFVVRYGGYAIVGFFVRVIGECGVGWSEIFRLDIVLVF